LHEKVYYTGPIAKMAKGDIGLSVAAAVSDYPITMPCTSQDAARLGFLTMMW
jgi:hypothetical protein